MASTSTPPVKLVKDQYHHAIPRFILRRFQVSSVKYVRLRKQTHVLARPGRKRRRQIPQDYLYYYNIDTREVELRAIATVYGSTNLYKDEHNTNDVMELEKKLSLLENKAARVISNIHKTIGASSTVKLRRGEVEDLRRFLFIMHYRGEVVSHNYFKEDHPENVSSQAWLLDYRERHGLKSPADMWLHVLRYYLDEPHEQMIIEYAKTKKKYGLKYNQMLLSTNFDPTVKYEALAYGLQAGAFFLSIWEAADDEEFLLGHTSFGLWEGLFMGQPCIHRIFIVSPRIAIILRAQGADPIYTVLSKDLWITSLLEIPATRAVVQYNGRHHGASGSPPQDLDASDDESLFQYRSSPQAKADVFTFTKTKLTVAQTDSINAVILLNIKPGGSLTFLSTQPTLRTLRKFVSAPTIRSNLTRDMFGQLIERLNNPSLLPTTPTPPGPPPRLSELIDTELAGASSFKSRYGTAYAIYRLCQNHDMPDSPFLSEQSTLADTAYRLFTARLDAPFPGFRPRPENLLLKDLSEKHSTIFFKTFDALCVNFGVEAGSDSDSELSKLVRQVAIVGFAERLAQTRPDVFGVLTKKLPMQLLR
ncbi:hypothetical protein PHLGIDRAFT_103165 [Phlebiopsis gigantea 11061_1 CR5-6]|uniref:DUF4238 domain-containing protein n=1 Tax=Phlebiopsis gigantea (strain 11061_1 CR5-6) TaxID=745531 RepID=A0A0C3PQ56_PHLG1|nr:hypothetical protein PHLGIDRAFT_103165 [Phlebiopsis gigantea 11061_1 CR5-6]